VFRALPGARNTRKDAYDLSLQPKELVHLSNKTLSRLSLNLEAINTHLDALASTLTCSQCDSAATPVIIDIACLFSTLAQLYEELADMRLENANLRAAIRATLSAEAEGESDPLVYLRWELETSATYHSAGGWSG
jgi:hypothetical protein